MSTSLNFAKSINKSRERRIIMSPKIVSITIFHRSAYLLIIKNNIWTQNFFFVVAVVVFVNEFVCRWKLFHVNSIRTVLWSERERNFWGKITLYDCCWQMSITVCWKYDTVEEVKVRLDKKTILHNKTIVLWSCQIGIWTFFFSSLMFVIVH